MKESKSWVQIESVELTMVLLLAFRGRHETAALPPYLLGITKILAEGLLVLTVAHTFSLDETHHWVAVGLGGKNRTLLYGDSRAIKSTRSFPVLTIGCGVIYQKCVSLRGQFR